MIYIATATFAEAKPLIERFALKREEYLPFSLFSSESCLLIVTGMGYLNAPIAAAALFAAKRPSATDLFVNVGVCAACTSIELGELLLAHKLALHHALGVKAFDCYSDILFAHELREVTLFSAFEPMASNVDNLQAVDMEAYFLFHAAKRFFSMERMLFMKVASDYFEPESVTPKRAQLLIASRASTIYSTVMAAVAMIDSAAKTLNLDALKRQQLEEFATLWRLSASQKEQLEGIAKWKAAYSGAFVLPAGVVPASKAERNSRFQSWLKAQYER